MPFFAHRDSGSGLLQRLGPQLTAAVDEDTVLRAAVATARTVLGTDAVEVVLYADPHAQRTGNRRARVGWGRLREPVVIDGSVVGHVAARVPLRRRARAGRQLARLAADVATAVQATRRYQAYRQEVQTAWRDPLTGLGNRALLREEGPRLLELAAERGDLGAVIAFDVDDFKWVNDSFGHAVGDEVLRHIGARVRSVLRHTDLAVRLGGDEFAVVISRLPSPRAVDTVAERLRRTLATRVQVGDAGLHVDVSMGVAVLGKDGSCLEDLLDAADAAAYEAKRFGQQPWHQTDRRRRDVAHSSSERASLAADLEQVVAGDGLLIHLQPQVGVVGGDIVGFEALARWAHPELGLLLPRDFLPLVERGGLTRPLTLAMLDRALAAQGRLRADVPGCRIAVNIWTRVLLDERLPTDLERLLALHRIPAAELTIEVTEAAVTPAAAVSGALGNLQALGCRVSLHEYGSGHTSLTSAVTNRGVRELKLAPALAGGVLADPDAERLVRAVASMAHSLDLEVVGEGVESVDVAKALGALGCDVLQGFHVQPPAALKETLAWARAWPGRRDEVLGRSGAASRREPPTA